VNAQGYIEPVPNSEYTEMGWEVCAPALYRLLCRIDHDYRLPSIYITENGSAYKDEIAPDGKIHDRSRLDYLRQHLIQSHVAMDAGVDIRGFFVWSLLDNFEWAHGYSKRFGLIRVEYDTQKRIIKESGEWYGHAIATNQVEG
jgi:beta-glucosidase